MKKWLLDDESEYTEDQIGDCIEKICEPEYYQDEDAFNDYIENEYGTVEIYGYEYSAVDVLQEMGGYRDALCDWADNEAESHCGDVEYELRHMSNAETIWLNAYQVTCVETETEEEAESKKAALEAQRQEDEKALKTWAQTFTIISV